MQDSQKKSINLLKSGDSQKPFSSMNGGQAFDYFIWRFILQINYPGASSLVEARFSLR